MARSPAQREPAGGVPRRRAGASGAGQGRVDGTPGARDKARARALFDALREAYPGAHCELRYADPYQLLVATILSAQATDASVNKATPALFARFPTPAHVARASPGEVEPFIKSIGLFRNKARAIHEACAAIVDRFAGEVPRTMDELLTLRGVARKTANVVLSNAFGVHEGFVVDTHVERLAKRFALVPRDATVPRIEQRLMQLLPREEWCDASHRLIWHGRRACAARGAACADHPVCTRFGVACELARTTPRQTARQTGRGTGTTPTPRDGRGPSRPGKAGRAT